MHTHCLSIKQIHDWHEGILKEEDAYYVVMHLDTCASCTEKERQLMDEDEQIFAAIATLGPVTQQMPDRLAAFQRLQEAMQQQSQFQANSFQMPETSIQHHATRKFHFMPALQRFWALFVKQITLVHRSIWLVAVYGLSQPLLSYWLDVHSCFYLSIHPSIAQGIRIGNGFLSLWSQPHQE